MSTTAWILIALGILVTSVAPFVLVAIAQRSDKRPRGGGGRAAGVRATGAAHATQNGAGLSGHGTEGGDGGGGA